MKDLDFRLDFCEVCFQMTNHIGDECQKCKSLEKKASNDEEFEDEEEERY